MGDCVGWWGRRRLTGANLRAWIVGVCRFAEPGRVGTPCFCGGVKSASLVARLPLRVAFCGGGGAGVSSFSSWPAQTCATSVSTRAAFSADVSATAPAMGDGGGELGSSRSCHIFTISLHVHGGYGVGTMATLAVCAARPIFFYFVISDATELHMFRQSVSSVHKTTRADMSSQTPWANLVEGLERLLSLRAGTPNFDPDVYARTKRMIVDTATRVSAAETAKINKMESELQQLKRELMEMRNALADTKQELQELRQLNEAALR